MNMHFQKWNKLYKDMRDPHDSSWVLRYRGVQNCTDLGVENLVPSLILQASSMGPRFVVNVEIISVDGGERCISRTTKFGNL